jgi:hypothetical protein
MSAAGSKTGAELGILDIVYGGLFASLPFYQLRARLHSELLLRLGVGIGCHQAAARSLGLIWPWTMPQYKIAGVGACSGQLTMGRAKMNARMAVTRGRNS